MTLLAIDTSTSVCVLGVRQGEETWVDETDLGRTHSREILPRIEALVSEGGVSKSDLNTIVYGQGPGSFTGLRIGIGVVQGLAYGLSIPVVGVSSLACLAQQFIHDEGNAALVALTARNTEVYFGAYEKHENGVRLVGREGVFEAAEIPAQSDSLNWCGVGGGWAFEEALQESARVDIFAVHLEPKIKAADLLDLGEIALGRGQQKNAFEALPKYLREQVAAKPKAKPTTKSGNIS